MGEDEEVGGGAEVWSQASQLCSGLVNKSWHANCVCTQAQTQTKYACVLWRGGDFLPQVLWPELAQPWMELFWDFGSVTEKG